MTHPEPIACELYDYIEIACMRHYDLRLTLKDGSEQAGQAITTRTGPDKIEYLVIQADGNSVDVPMHTLARLTVLNENAMFQDVDF